MYLENILRGYGLPRKWLESGCHSCTLYTNIEI